MIIYSNPDGSWPKPRDIGCKDYYHDINGKYDGHPIFVPLEYKGKEMEYYINKNREKHGEDYIPDPPKYDPKQEYQLEKETGAENLSWGRNHYAERCGSNREYEAWINNWN